MAGDVTAEQRLAALETEIARMRQQLDRRLGAVAEELRRAEMRDEWTASQLRDMKKVGSEQRGLIADIHAAVAVRDD